MPPASGVAPLLDSPLSSAAGHPQTPAKGAAPLWIPAWGMRFNYGADHPSGHLPLKKGESKEE